MTMLHDNHDEFEPAHGRSPTAQILDNLELYGFQPNHGDRDPRPLPDTGRIEAAISSLFEILGDALHDTRLEPHLDDLLWHLTDLFHKKAARIQRLLDSNEDRQKRSQQDQDGSEVRSVELERLIEQGLDLIERRESFEQMRELAAEHYEATTGSAWRPRTGSHVNHRHMTAALIDSRDFIAARRRSETEPLLAKGTKVAFSGGVDYTDAKRIWAVLDKVRERHPDMVLLHGGARGADLAASRWADHREIRQIVFKLDRTEGRAAPFKRNDRILDLMPTGVIVFPGSGITGNLADKAKKLGIPVLDHRGSA
jgi:hypothetical protein